MILPVLLVLLAAANGRAVTVYSFIGESLTLNCIGQPGDAVKWSHGTETQTQIATVTAGTDGDCSKRITVKAFGEYKATASNGTVIRTVDIAEHDIGEGEEFRSSNECHFSMSTWGSDKSCVFEARCLFDHVFSWTDFHCTETGCQVINHYHDMEFTDISLRFSNGDVTLTRNNGTEISSRLWCPIWNEGRSHWIVAVVVVLVACAIVVLYVLRRRKSTSPPPWMNMREEPNSGRLTPV